MQWLSPVEFLEDTIVEYEYERYTYHPLFIDIYFVCLSIIKVVKYHDF